jgi:hypothetical protein
VTSSLAEPILFSSFGFLPFNILTFEHSPEALLNVITSYCTSLLVKNTKFLGKSSGFGCYDDLLRFKVGFVANYYYHHILSCEFTYILDPTLYAFEGGLVCHIEDHQSSQSFAVVTMLFK